MNEKIFSLVTDISPVSKKGDTFFMQDGYFVNSDDSVSIKATPTTKKLFKYESRR